MKACQNCRFADEGSDNGIRFYFCRWLPPRADGTVPTMKPSGYCGQFKLAVLRWLKNSVRRAT